jgi:hypothetical protein
LPIEIGYGLGLRMNYFQTGREVMGFVLADARVQNFVLVYDGRAISVYRNADKQELFLHSALQLSGRASGKLVGKDRRELLRHSGLQPSRQSVRN